MTRVRRRALALAAAGLAAPALARPAAAQGSWPERPVRFVVAFAPGGFADLIGRALGEQLADVWRQPVVVENRGGAGGNVAAQQLARGGRGPVGQPAQRGHVARALPLLDGVPRARRPERRRARRRRR